MKLIYLLLTTLILTQSVKGTVNVGQPNTVVSNTTAFEENKGQVLGEDASKVKYFFKKGDMTIFLLSSGLAYQFEKTTYPSGFKQMTKTSTAAEWIEFERLRKEITTETFRMDMQLIGANPSAKIVAEGKGSDYTHYYNYNVLDVYSYSKVTFQNVYPNIDWVVSKNETGIKYDFIVHPGGKPSDIKMEAKYMNSLTQNADGSVTLLSSLGKVVEKTPISFQNGKSISTSFQLNQNTLSFKLADYDASQDLIIDPFIRWSTYYGGTVVDIVQGMAMREGGVGVVGNMFIAGSTASTTKISAGGYQNAKGGGTYDAFIAAIDRNGVRQGATYYGGTGDDYGWGCDREEYAGGNNYYLIGQTNSTNAISSVGAHQTTNNGGSSDAFIVKFNTFGGRTYGSYYGGSGSDIGYGIATDGLGNVYLTGSTAANNGIASASSHQTSSGGGGDAFLVKFSATGARVWGTFYGGSSPDIGYAVCVDKSKNVLFAGYTLSTTAIATAGVHQTSIGGGQDAFVAKFTATGTRLGATYYGDAGTDRGYTCKTDTFNNIYLGGMTTSSSAISTASAFQTAIGGSQDGYLVKMDSVGTRLWATYYGGTGDDDVQDCAVYSNGDVFITGTTNSSSAIASGGYQNSLAGGTDAFVAKINSAGTTRAWGSYHGGSGADNATGIAAEITGGVVAFCGSTTSTSGIATSIASTGSYQDTFGGGASDGFLARICDSCVTPVVTIAHNIANDTLCSGATITFTATPTNGGSGGGYPFYQWYRNRAPVTNMNPYTSNNLTQSTDTIWCIMYTNLPNASVGFDTSNYLTLTVLGYSTPTFAPLQFRACKGDTFFFPSNKAKTHSLTPRNFESRTGTWGTYTDTVNIPGSACDSVYRFQVTIGDPASNNGWPTPIYVCRNDTFYHNGKAKAITWTGFPAAVNYIIDTLKNASSLGCDSIANFYITGSNPTTTTLTPNPRYICKGQTFQLGNKLLSNLPAGAPIFYYDTLVSKLSGCDSIVRVNLGVRPTYDTTINRSICQGQSFSFGSMILSVSGNYVQMDTTTRGCDSITRLNLTVESKTVLPNKDTVLCPGRSMTFGTQLITAPGIYRDTLKYLSGCDSVLSLWNVISGSNDTFRVYHTVCSNRLVSFNGQYPSVPGIYYDTLPNRNNCDSLVIMTLKIINTSTSVISDTICYNGSYKLKGKTVTSPGVYYDTILNKEGCDSIMTINLAKRAQKTLTIVNTSGTLVGTSGFSFYQWYRNNASLRYENNYFHNPLSSGTYKLKSTDANSCSYVSNDLNYYASSIQNGKSLDFLVYPIPTTDILYIQSSAILDKETTLHIYSVDGKKMACAISKQSSNIVSFSTAQWSKGMYLIEMRRKDKVEQKTFVVE